MKLYPCFTHWLNNSTVQNAIWLFSDPHFGDEEMQSLRTYRISDEELIKRINSKVGKHDTVICLGDVGDVSYVQKIKGYKVLILGNHDQGASNFQRIETFVKPEEITDTTRMSYIEAHYRKMYYPETGTYYYHDNKLFDEVYEGSLQIAPKIILSHEPVDYKYCFNIHGHDHNGSPRENHLNLCVELIDYTPVNLNSIVNSGMLKNIPDVHRDTIDRATNKTQ